MVRQGPALCLATMISASPACGWSRSNATGQCSSMTTSLSYPDGSRLTKVRYQGPLVLSLFRAMVELTDCHHRYVKLYVSRVSALRRVRVFLSHRVRVPNLVVVLVVVSHLAPRFVPRSPVQRHALLTECHNVPQLYPPLHVWRSSHPKSLSYCT